MELKHHGAAWHCALLWQPVGFTLAHGFPKLMEVGTPVEIYAISIMSEVTLSHAFKVVSVHRAGVTILSQVVLVRGYHQVPVHPHDVSKTAVIVPFGLFEFLLISFGLKGVAQAFQWLVDSVQWGLQLLLVYLDNILVPRMSAEEHLSHLWKVFKRLNDHGLIVNLAKC